MRSTMRTLACRLVALVALSTAGCGGKPEGKVTVGFSQIGAESEWRTAETISVKEEAKKRGINLKFYDAQQRQENQIKAIKAFIRQKVDAIILAPVVETGWEPVLRDAKRANIPVVLVDRMIDVSDDSLFTAFVGPDSIEEGRVAGRLLAKFVNGKANIVELQGTTGSAPAISRKKGFAEVIAKYPDMKIIASQDGNFTRTNGKEVMEAFIKSKGKQINAVFGHNDDMAIGAIQAMEEAGMKPGEEIIVVSVDAVHGAFEAMIAGTLNATVECNPLLGPYAFDLVEKIIKGEKVEKMNYVPVRHFLKENAKEDIKTRKY